MGALKDHAEDIEFAKEKISKIFHWALPSLTKRMLFLVALALIPQTLQYIYLSNLLELSSERTDAYLIEANLLNKEFQLKIALDTVELCINSLREKSTHSDWYCNIATEKYLEASRARLQEWPKKVVSEKAYGIMKIDIAHYIRSISFDRLNNQPSEKSETLDFLLSKPGITITTLLNLLLLLYAAYILRKMSLQATPP